MIQIILMDGRKFINKHAQFKDKNVIGILNYIETALADDDHSIIEISKWVQTPEGNQIPTKLKRLEKRTETNGKKDKDS